MKHHLLNSLLGLGLGLSCVGQAHALIDYDDNGELVLLIWDASNKVSYTRDLGLLGKDFWVSGQQDAGFTSSFSLSAGGEDKAFTEFKRKSPDVSKQVWAVFGVDTTGSVNEPKEHWLWTTLKSGSTNGVINPEWTRFTGLKNENFFLVPPVIEGFFAGNNGIAADANLSTHLIMGDVEAGERTGKPNGWNFSDNDNPVFKESYPGTGFTKAGQAGSEGEYVASMYNPFNPVGKSSWFYAATAGGKGAVSDKASFDEFDNLGDDGYWGLGVDASGAYQLTYTLPKHTKAAQVSTAEGRARLSVTDFSSAIGSRQVLLADEFAVTAVPEPSSWALMGLGVAGLAALGRRRARKEQAA